MIYREMPATWDAAFRRDFYQRWGRESAVISARCRRVEYPEFTQLLSIKMLCGGAEEYFLDGRRIAVDDDTYLILNAGRRYGSRIASQVPVHSFSVFFEPRLVQEVVTGLQWSAEKQLAYPGEQEHAVPGFGEHLREHDCLVTPLMKQLAREVDAGRSDPAWMDEQLRLLLAGMTGAERREEHCLGGTPARPAARRELRRRLEQARTFIHTSYRQPLRLAQIARAAHLSPYHLLRSFKASYGISPAQHLAHKRLHAAVRLIESTSWPLSQIAVQVGFGSRTTLFRHLRAAGLRARTRPYSDFRP